MEKMDKATPEKEQTFVVGGGVKWYQEKIMEMVSQIDDEKLLKRIYNLAEYLYIYK